MENFYVPDTSKPEPRRPRKDFVDAALALAKEKWGTNAGILKAMSYGKRGDLSKNETLRRLKDGKGSDKSARALLEALKRANVDVSALPKMYDDETEQEPWQEYWLRAGELLHKYAPLIYDQTVDGFREIVNALERREKAEQDLGRAT